MVVSNEFDILVFIEVVSGKLPKLTVVVIDWFVFKTIVAVVKGLVVFNPVEIVNPVENNKLLSVDKPPFVDVVNNDTVETYAFVSVGNSWLVVVVANDGLLLSPDVKDVGMVFCW